MVSPRRNHKDQLRFAGWCAHKVIVTWLGHADSRASYLNTTTRIDLLGQRSVGAIYVLTELADHLQPYLHGRASHQLHFPLSNRSYTLPMRDSYRLLKLSKVENYVR